MVLGVFVDLKKAFDTIDHNRLLLKLERCGIRGVALARIKSSLSNRSQFVQIGNYKSSQRNLTCGVPQGSVLGHKLIILHKNDICKVSKQLKLTLFAEDTTIFCAGDDLKSLLDLVSIEMTTLKTWFDLNKLSLNLNKTKLMLFTNRNVNIPVQVTVNEVNIELVQETKFLGVILDDKISWKSHVKYIGSKIARNIGIIGKVKYILNEKSLYMLY